MNRAPVTLATLAVLLAALVLRATAAEPTCDATYACPKGQTCATKDGRAFACVPAGAGKLGERCDATVNGNVTCGEGLSCMATGVPSKGTCVAWCGRPGGCSPGTTCGAVTTTMGAALKLCLPCNLAYACGAGQTCATKTGAFSCMPAGNGAEGDACNERVGAVITCGERLACLAFGSPKKMGTCVRWCDKAHACAAGKSCQVVTTTKGAALTVCL